jgi:site-specific recombinase XerD
MSDTKWFRKVVFSELPKKSSKNKRQRWEPTEEKVLWELEQKKLKRTCLELKRIGVRRKEFHLIRDWFMIELGLFTGLRVMEKRDLKIKDLNIYDDHSSVIVRKGKGNKRRNVRFNSKFKKICFEFLKLREKFGFSNEKEDFLFVSNEGVPLTTRALHKRFKICTEKAGLKSHHSIHHLRHTYATFLLESGAELKYVKKQLGHSSIKITELYLGLREEKNKAALENLYETKKGGDEIKKLVEEITIELTKRGKFK